MESSQMFGGTEECHSSESGWTMYIGSPIYGDDDDDDHGDNGTHDDEDHDGDGDDDDDDGNRDDDSDDSMASDASSGPSHSLAVFKHEEEENDNKHRLEKKSDKQKHKAKAVQIRAQSIKEEKEDQAVFMARKANNIASAQSGAIAKLMSRKTATHSTYDFRSRNTNVGRHEQIIKSSPICQYARANSSSYYGLKYVRDLCETSRV